MDMFQNNIGFNQSNALLQSNFGLKNSAGNSFLHKNKNNEAYYAKKGEPMYMKDMDTDEDGIVTFEEFKDYCAQNGISTKEMIKMIETANSYRTMQAQKKSEKEVQQNSSGKKTEMNEFVYAKRGDARYDKVMDTNNDDKVSYKEYLEYCQEHSHTKHKSKAKIEESENGEFKTINSGKAINTYCNSFNVPQNIIEDLC